MPPVRQPSGRGDLLRPAVRDPGAARAGPVGCHARPRAARLRGRLRLPQRGHEQHRRGPGGRAAAAGHAGLPRRVELRRPGRGGSGRPARATPVPGPGFHAGGPGRPARHRGGRAHVAERGAREGGPADSRGLPGRPGSGGQKDPGVASGEGDRTGGRRLRPDRAVRRLRRGRHRRLGRAAPAAGPRGRRGPSRRGLRGLRAGRGDGTAVRHVPTGAPRPDPGAGDGRRDRVRRDAAGFAGPGRVAGAGRVRGHRPRAGQSVPGRHRTGWRGGRIGRGGPDLDARLQRVPARTARDRLPGHRIRPARRPDHSFVPGAGRRRHRLRFAGYRQRTGGDDR
jgi:hypothetical protein